jgi:hypothetical protein
MTARLSSRNSVTRLAAGLNAVHIFISRLPWRYDRGTFLRNLAHLIATLEAKQADVAARRFQLVLQQLDGQRNMDHERVV